MTLLLIPAAAGLGCGESEPPPPDPGVFTTVQVVPDTATLFTVAPGTSVLVRAIAKDQYGVTLTDVSPAAFSSGDPAIATVSEGGTATAVAPGSTAITATVTSGEITQSGAATITVQDPPPTARVETPGRRFQPFVVDIAVGGSVTWQIGSTDHDVFFSTAGAPDNIQATRNASVTRTFPTKNDFSYRCRIHTGMNGLVRVH
jgi:plastocyanin